MLSDGAVVTGELMVGGRVRGCTFRVPRAAVEGESRPPVAGGEPRPLVVVLHGNHPEEGAGSRMMREWTTFDAQADARGWVIAYPDGHGGSWADGRGVTSADEAGVDDVAFLRALIDHAAARYGTTPDRTVVAGISNGAFMAQRLALAAGDRVAVLAAVAGTMPAALRDLRPAYAVSALLIHGTADRLAPIEGGYSRRRGPNGELRGRTLSLQESAERWREIDRCPPGPGQAVDSEFSSRVTACDGVGGTRVSAWTVFGLGHGLPGVPMPSEEGEPVTTEFDAAEEICRFAAPLLLSADTRRLTW
ncbi:alpha/beta hydrolase family esterase [Nonomuraea jiangxiensis]|uniref:Polyhydroxybutyrate depolymerase n=1 Tax=Nonomuraea jiangxiensis TaxID=633440 RepID=A0A1G9VYX0_9ACTN|nr:PHB depolymerase family esterase [Nonomuraea jiangxiensis]SDM77333.1 polyhydroxybutyrate depolymerase [Nonomuraea jiangxiensis]